ncbi:MAG TPA: protoporphyrinogen oxidase [Acidimicrobiia bacterium]|nr:protoporphyrinogen oxidase [Acidimicrobiia bacterium]
MIEATTDPRVVVIGGGISGLAAAHRLSTLGLSVTLVDKSERLGGKVSTDHVDGFVIESGPDSFVAGKETVIELATELGIEDQIISTRPEHRGSYVWSRHRLHPLPEGLLLMTPSRLGPLFRSSLLSRRGRLRAAGDLLVPRRQAEGDESLESFVVRRLGREVLDRIAEPLIAGIHAAEPASMSLEASFPRFLEMERDHRSLILAARALSKRASTVTSHFASFRRGMGELTAALIESLEVTDRKTAVSVIRLRDGAVNRFSVDLSDGTQIGADGVVLAVPARDAVALLRDTSPGAGDAVGGIRQVSTTAVTLAYRSDQIPVLSGTGFVIPAVEGRRLMGVSYLSRKWEERVPSEQFVLLRAFLRRGAAEGRLPTEVARAELADLIGIRARPILERTHHWDDGLHQYTLGHRQRVAKAEQCLQAIPGLAIAGAAFHGIGLNECIASGRRAADQIAASVKGSIRSVMTH